MPSARTLTLPGIWAEDAQTIIPQPPIPGIAYRNEAIVGDDWRKGQLYSEVLDSATWNQKDYTLSAIIKMLEQYGVLPWSALTTYPVSGICMGLDGVLYSAKLSSGPGSENGVQQPTGDEEDTYWGVISGGGGGGAQGNVPIGGIIMWSGAIPDIPAGWLLCNGASGTPDLRDRFIIGAGLNYASGSSGGSSTHTHTTTVGGTAATGTIAGTTLTIAQMPAHTHSVPVAPQWNGTATIAGGVEGSGGTRSTGSQGGGQSHTHAFTGVSHTHTITLSDANTLPPYFALAYIMRVA